MTSTMPYNPLILDVRLRVCPARLGGRVLLAEDNKDNQQLISLLIRRSGASVTLAGNGQEAVELAQAADYDLVLMDLQMPVMGGLEAIELLRLTGFDGPVLVLTANVSETDRLQAQAAGGDGFLTKPIVQEEFFAALEQYLPAAGPALSETQDGWTAPPSLGTDPEFHALRDNFLQELPLRLRDLEQACADQDWPLVRSLAHQLKGVAATFGLPEATRVAGAVEFQVVRQDYAEVRVLVGELVSLCQPNP